MIRTGQDDVRPGHRLHPRSRRLRFSSNRFQSKTFSTLPRLYAQHHQRLPQQLLATTFRSPAERFLAL